jgi:hypothetical protein
MAVYQSVILPYLHIYYLHFDQILAEKNKIKSLHTHYAAQFMGISSQS